MEQIGSQTQTAMCPKHSNKKLEFIQVNNLQNVQDNSLFYCTSCVNKDLTFKGINYLLMSQIIEEGQTNILQKWPPINDQSLFDKLIEFTENQNSSSLVTHRINAYFTQLKQDFLIKVDLCEKKMINHALELPLGKQSLLNQYQHISSITQFRNLLIEGESQEAEAHQSNCRQFITLIESQKEKNSELISRLVQQFDQKEHLVDFDYPDQIKDSIFSLLDQIDFFNSTDNLVKNPSNVRRNEESNTSKIMKLISNKFNFCSTDFLSQLQTQLDKINPLLSSISFENIHLNNKSPLDLSSLSEERFTLVKEFIEHQIHLESNNEFIERIQNSFEYNLLDKIIESRVNFVNDRLKEQLKRWIIDSYSLLKQVNFTNAIIDSKKFDCFVSLSETDIEDICSLTRMKKTLYQENNYQQSQTQKMTEQTMEIYQQFEDADIILRKFPIFDLMKRKKDQPLEIKLTKTNYRDGYNLINIHNGSQYSNSYGVSNYLNCVSDIILDKDKKYIFRFSVSYLNGQYLMLGLMENSKCNSKDGHKSKLSCQFYYQNNQIEYCGGCGIDKHLKGDKIRIGKDNQIEMRVWLRGQQLEILDYPNYQFKLALEDKYKIKLIDQNDLKLYLSLYYAGSTITLLSALLVDYFPN